MVVAVSKGRQLNQMLVAICRSELLRENGVGNAAVLGFVPAVSDAKPGASLCDQIVFKIVADSLY